MVNQKISLIIGEETDSSYAGDPKDSTITISYYTPDHDCDHPQQPIDDFDKTTDSTIEPTATENGSNQGLSPSSLKRDSSRDSIYGKIVSRLSSLRLTPTSPKHNDGDESYFPSKDSNQYAASEDVHGLSDKEPPEPSPKSMTTDDEIDVAAINNDGKSSSYFAKLLSTDSGIPGAKLLKYLYDDQEKQKDAENYDEQDSKPSVPSISLLSNISKLPLPFYAVYDSDSDNDDTSKKETKDSTQSPVLKSKDDASDTESVDTFHTTTSRRRPEDVSVILDGISEEIKDDGHPTPPGHLEGPAEIGKISNSNSEERSSEYSEMASELDTSTFSHEILDEDVVTPFQQSVINNMNPDEMSEGFLMKIKNIDDEKKVQQVRKNLRLRIAKRLQKVFDIDDDDELYGNYNVWLIKDVLLQGHLFLTRESVFFFAFLPKRYSPIMEACAVTGNGIIEDDSDVVIQSGSLGLKTAKYGETVFSTVITHRFWAILRPQTLSIYSSSTDLYFPNIVIDMKSCIKAVVLEKEKDNSIMSPCGSRSNSASHSGTSTPWTRSGVESPISHRGTFPSRASSESLAEDCFSESASSLSPSEVADMEDTAENITSGSWFELTTTQKTYRFHTDSLFSARQWCHNLTKIIFQVNNSNRRDEVLLKVPIENIFDFGRNTLFASDTKDDQEVEIIVGSDSEEEDNNGDDDTPMSFGIHYFDNSEQSKRMSSAQKFKKRMKRNHKESYESNEQRNSEYPVQSTYFVFFNDGDEFYDRFHDVVLKNQTANEKTSLRSDSSKGRFFDRAKKIMRRTDVPTERVNRCISTLTYDLNQSSIVSQVSPFNADNRLLPESNGFLSPTDSESTLKKLGQSLTHPTKMFKRVSSSADISSLSDTSSPYTINSEYDTYSSSMGPKQILNLPRPMTVEGLKNLKMIFETSRKDIRVAEKRYKEVVGDNEHIISQNSMISTDSESIMPGPLSLSDPSEYEADNTRRSKLHTLKNNMKAFSNVGSMWSANPSHYIEEDVEDHYYIKDSVAREVAEKHFRSHFSLGQGKRLVATYYARLQRTIPVYGKLYLGNEDLCFRSLLPGVATKMILPLKDVEDCTPSNYSKIACSPLTLILGGGEEIYLELNSQSSRKDCRAMILRQLELLHAGENYIPELDGWGGGPIPKKILEADGPSKRNRKSLGASKIIANARIDAARMKMFEDRISSLSGLDIPIMLEDSPFYKTEIKPNTSYNFVLLTIGSRGDVQPYIALGKALLKEGHNVTIATHSEFKDWIEKYGISFRNIAGDPSELMSLMVSHGSMSLAFLKEASAKFKDWINDLLLTSWEACQGCDILIESPSAMAGVHIAEALGVPYMRAFTMPWTRTKAYPHAFIVPEQKKGSSYNYLTHVMFENVFWKGIGSQVNRWRVQKLGLPKTNLYRLQQSKIPFLYNISPTIFPASVDFPDWVKVTGYWFLDEGSADDYTPPKELDDFITKAREDDKKIIYIGFGSIVVNDATKLTKAIVEAVLDADVRCILNKGWSDRLTKKDENSEPEVELPEQIYNSGSIPHDWLFTHIDAAVHHGGSGTTGATLRSGIPTIIKPFFGDQFFYASRIEETGVGVALKKLNAKSLSKSIKTVISDVKMIEKAKKLSERIKHEHGTAAAIEMIYTELEYARTLIIAKQKYNETHRHMISGIQTPVVPEESTYDDDDNDDNDDE